MQTKEKSAARQKPRFLPRKHYFIAGANSDRERSKDKAYAKENKGKYVTDEQMLDDLRAHFSNPPSPLARR